MLFENLFSRFSASQVALYFSKGCMDADSSRENTSNDKFILMNIVQFMYGSVWVVLNGNHPDKVQ